MVGAGRDRPELFREEGHEGMQELQDLIEHETGCAPGLVLGGSLLPLQKGLHQLEIPVAENIPEEAIGGIGGIVEAIGFDRLGDLPKHLRGLVEYPAIERDLDPRQYRAEPRAAVDLSETRGVPKLRCEISISLYARHR